MKFSIANYIKPYLPKSLYKRFLLITLVPITIIQILSLYFFINRNWIENSTKLSMNLINEISYVINIYENNIAHFKSFNNKLINTTFHEFKGELKTKTCHKNLNLLSMHFFKKLFRTNFKNTQFQILQQNNIIFILIKSPKGNLLFKTPKNNIILTSNNLFILLNILITILFTVLSMLFMKSQISPIIYLSRAINNFKANKTMPSLRPSGANEIREVFISFNQMTKDLLQYINEKDIILAGISHDIKTYLTRIKLQFALLDLKTQSCKMLNQDINDIELILNQFIDYSQISYTTEPKNDKVDLHSLIQDVAYNYMSKHFKIKILDFNSIITCNLPDIKRCITNIIKNSSKYSTELTINSIVTDNNIFIYFHDNGPGVPEESLHMIIKPFYKVDQSRNVSKGGSGLGLAITDCIVKKHGGHLSFKNSQSPQGFYTIIKLPLTDY